MLYLCDGDKFTRRRITTIREAVQLGHIWIAGDSGQNSTHRWWFTRDPLIIGRFGRDDLIFPTHMPDTR